MHLQFIMRNLHSANVYQNSDVNRPGVAGSDVDLYPKRPEGINQIK